MSDLLLGKSEGRIHAAIRPYAPIPDQYGPYERLQRDAPLSICPRSIPQETPIYDEMKTPLG